MGAPASGSARSAGHRALRDGPGVQSQFDWSDYTVQLGSALTRVVLYETILSYSRRLHYSASLDATQPSIFEALEEAFWHFGGVTKTLLVDNPRAFVLDVRPSHFRWTVREALRSTAPPRYGPRLARPSVVDPHRAYLAERAPLVGYSHGPLSLPQDAGRL